MATVAQPFRCDACGKLRETDANRWFLLWQGTSEPRGLTITRWDATDALVANVRHACGVTCALGLTEKFLALGALPDGPPPDPRTMLEK